MCFVFITVSFSLRIPPNPVIIPLITLIYLIFIIFFILSFFHFLILSFFHSFSKFLEAKGNAILRA